MTPRKRIRWQAREAWGALLSSDRCFHHRPYAGPSTPRHHTVRGRQSILRDGIARRITFARLAMVGERLNGLGTECGSLRTVASRLCCRALITYCRRSGLRNWTRQIVYHDTKPERCFKELHGPRSHAGVRLANRLSFWGGSSSPERFCQPKYWHRRRLGINPLLTLTALSPAA